MEDKRVPKTAKSRRRQGWSGNVVTIRFTGAAGGHSYAYDGFTLARGDVITVDLEGHWLVLLESGDAEIVTE